MSRHFSKVAIIGAAIGVMAMGSAYATPELMLSSGADNITVTGGGGSVSYNNANFDGWNIEVLFGASNSPGLAPFGIDLTNLTVTCAVGGPCSKDSLTIELSDNGFMQKVGANGLSQTLSATLTGATSITQSAFFDTGNALFGTGGTIGASITCTVSCAHTEVGGGPAGPADYSLTLEDVLAAGTVSYSSDSNITAPEPGTIALFGAALLGCALFLGRRRLPNL